MHITLKNSIYTILLFLDYYIQENHAAIGSRSKSKLGLRPNHCSRNVSTGAQIDVPQSSRCIALYQPYCLDLELPYRATTFPDTTFDLNFSSTDEIQTYLQSWYGARKFPKCWPVLRVALCSIFMPQCDEELATGRVTRISKPSVDICHDVLSNCPFIGQHFGWPKIFNCSDSNIYSKDCTNELRDLRFSQSSPTCQHPLVPSDDKNHWFENIEGCSLSCKFPISDTSDQVMIRWIIGIICTIGLIATFVAVMLFIVNRASSKSSIMAKVIIHCNICDFVNYLGWSMQFIFKLFHYDDIACGANGSTLYGLPLVLDPCVLSFLLTYLPSLSSLLWKAHLGKLCYIKLKPNDNRAVEKTTLDRTLSISNYGTPAFLLVSVSLLGHIDGNGIYGICTVGQQSTPIKIVFVFVPRLFGTIYANFYFYMTIFKLASVKKMKPSLKRYFFRISALAVLSSMEVILGLGIYLYEFNYRDSWIKAISNSVACNLRPSIREGIDSSPSEICIMESKPTISLYYFELLAMLSQGIVISSWVIFFDANLRGLRRKIIDLLEDEQERQRRTAANDTNWQLVEDDMEERCRDLIDMPSSTRQAMDLNCNELSNHPSLQSCSITDISLSNINYTKRHRPLQNEPTSRDLINSIRYQQQQQPPATNQNMSVLFFLQLLQQQQLQQQQLLNTYRSRCPDLNGPKSQDIEPQFIHVVTAENKG